MLSGRAVLAMEDVDIDDGVDATMILNADYTIGSDTASVSFQFAGTRPAEIANMFQAFDWLRNLDTQASGSVRADLDGSGRLGNLHGVLELSEGALRESPASQKIAFSQAKVYFEYDPETDALNMSQVTVKTSFRVRIRQRLCRIGARRVRRGTLYGRSIAHDQSGHQTARRFCHGHYAGCGGA